MPKCVRLNSGALLLDGARRAAAFDTYPPRRTRPHMFVTEQWKYQLP